MIKKSIIFTILFSLVFLNVTLFASEAESVMHKINISDLFQTVKTLSSEEMAGRLSGAPEYSRSAEWVIKNLKKWGLKPVYKDYYRPFYIDYNKITKSSLVFKYTNLGGKKITRQLKLMDEYIPDLYTGFGKGEGEVVFVGYGITAPELGWDDYKGINVKGKYVLTLFGFPPIKDKDFSKYWESGKHKSLNAKKRGALGIIRIATLGAVVGDRYVEDFRMLRISIDIAFELLENIGKKLENMSYIIDSGENCTFNTGITASIEIDGTHYPKAKTYDVVAMIEGSDPKLKNEYILIGAHLDHIGNWPVLLPGANDNASGVAVVMEIAKAFSLLSKPPKRSIVFNFFAAEERGGSSNSSASMIGDMPKFPSKINWMINFDLVGVGNKTVVAGAAEYPELFRTIKNVKDKYSIKCEIVAEKNEGFYTRSDHSAFIAKKIPAYGNMANGENYGYHTGKDDIYNITPQIMEDLARVYFMAIYNYLNK